MGNEYYAKNFITKYIYMLYLISNTRLKVTKNQAKAKQHSNAEPFLFENYFLSLSMFLASKNSRAYWMRYDYDENEKMKNRTHRYSINTPNTRHGYKYKVS